MSRILVYSRRGCHLCEILVDNLLTLVRGRANVTICDIDSREDWRQTYDVRVPVVELDGNILCENTLDSEVILTALLKLAEAE